MSRSKRIIFKIATALMAVLLLFLIAEVITRIGILCKKKNDFRAIMRRLPPLKEGAKASLGDILRPSAYPRIIYELRPSIDLIFEGAALKINRQGWRCDHDLEPGHSGHTLRVICLGDSHMFGWGIPMGQEMPRVLERQLNAGYPRKKWQVINTAVPGYNTAMEVETLEKKCLAYKPDIVIIEFIGNDLDLPNFIWVSENWLDPGRLFFLDFIEYRVRIAMLCCKLRQRSVNIIIPDSRKAHGNYFQLRPSPKRSEGEFENDPEKIPGQYRDMVGWDGYCRAMKRLKELQSRYGFEVVSLITWNGEDDRALRLSRALGFHTLRNNAYNASDPSLVLNEKDPHPSALCHEKTAEMLLLFMDRDGIIKRQIEK